MQFYVLFFRQDLIEGTAKRIEPERRTRDTKRYANLKDVSLKNFPMTLIKIGERNCPRYIMELKRAVTLTDCSGGISWVALKNIMG